MMVERIRFCQSRGRLPPDLHPGSAAGGCLAMIERLAASPRSYSCGNITQEYITWAAAYFLAVLMQGLPLPEQARGCRQAARSAR
jgi:hypothetical protein